MYLLLTDETNLQESAAVKFLVYGGLFFRLEKLADISNQILEIRKKYKFKETDKLKFSTNECPSQVDRDAINRVKNEVFEVCLNNDCRFIAYVIHHRIVANQKDNKIKYAVDHVLNNFHSFLEETKDDGICLFDPLPIKNDMKYIKEKFTRGLCFHNSSYKRLDRIKLFGTTGLNLSHVSSAIDVVLGAFRYCINSPKNR